LAAEAQFEGQARRNVEDDLFDEKRIAIRPFAGMLQNAIFADVSVARDAPGPGGTTWTDSETDYVGQSLEREDRVRLASDKSCRKPSLGQMVNLIVGRIPEKHALPPVAKRQVDGRRKHRVDIRVNRGAALPKGMGGEVRPFFGVTFHSFNRWRSTFRELLYSTA